MKENQNISTFTDCWKTIAPTFNAVFAVASWRFLTMVLEGERKPENRGECIQELPSDSNRSLGLNWETWSCEVATLPADNDKQLHLMWLRTSLILFQRCEWMYACNKQRGYKKKT